MTEILSVGFGISTDWTMKSAIITTMMFVLLPHIGMGIIAVIEVVKCGLRIYFWMIVENMVALYTSEINNGRNYIK